MLELLTQEPGPCWVSASGFDWGCVITYTDSVQGITPNRLDGFFVGWPDPPTPETHLQLLTNSAYVVLAVDDETGNVVGYITAISDGVLAAYIPHLEVLPAFQGQGIGSELLRRMLQTLRRFYMVDLICDPEVQPFYARWGMRPYSGMILRNYDRQSGT
jgi:GNAT superfamily N-acetyltransferase